MKIKQETYIIYFIFIHRMNILIRYEPPFPEYKAFKLNAFRGSDFVDINALVVHDQHYI